MMDADASSQSRKQSRGGKKHRKNTTPSVNSDEIDPKQARTAPAPPPLLHPWDPLRGRPVGPRGVRTRSSPRNVAAAGTSRRARRVPARLNTEPPHPLHVPNRATHPIVDRPHAQPTTAPGHPMEAAAVLQAARRAPIRARALVTPLQKPKITTNNNRTKATNEINE